MQYRIATISDWSTMHQVRMSVRENILSDPTKVTVADFQVILNTGGKAWVCEVNKQVVGFCILDFEKQNVWALFLLPEFEGKGIGKKLHDNMIEWAGDKGMEYLWLSTDPGTRAAGFYRKKGWKEVGLMQNGELKFEWIFKNKKNLVFDPFPNLQSKRLTLRQLRPSDKLELFNLRADKENIKYIDRKAPENTDEVLEFIDKINNSVKNNEILYWAIALNGEDKLIGTFCLWHFSPDCTQAEIGYELNPNHHGKGIMSEALNCVIDFAFKKLNLKILEAFTHVENIGSIKLLQKNNFLKNKIIKEKSQMGKGEILMVRYLLENKKKE